MAEARKIYIDSCCFIDMVKTETGKSTEDEREKDVWCLKRLLEANRDGEVEVYSSTLTIAECIHAGKHPVPDDVKSLFTRLLTSGQYLRLVQLTPFIAEEARDLRWDRGIALSGADGVHVASALDRECEEFLTSDGRIHRVSKFSDELSKLGLYVRHGRDTVCLPAKYRQLDLPGDDEAC